MDCSGVLLAGVTVFDCDITSPYLQYHKLIFVFMIFMDFFLESNDTSFTYADHILCDLCFFFFLSREYAYTLCVIIQYLHEVLLECCNAHLFAVDHEFDISRYEFTIKILSETWYRGDIVIILVK